MAEEIKAVEAEQVAAVETVEEVDFNKELEEATEAQKNWDMGAKRIAKKAPKEEFEFEEVKDSSDEIADKVIAKVLPALKVTAESSAVGVKLDKLAQGNEPLKKLIKFHYENSVNPSMDLDSRIEAAYAIANRKVIEKTAKEINIARQNRSQVSNISQGQSSETQIQPGQNVLSEGQLKDLRRVFDNNRIPGTFEKFVENTIKRFAKDR